MQSPSAIAHNIEKLVKQKFSDVYVSISEPGTIFGDYSVDIFSHPKRHLAIIDFNKDNNFRMYFANGVFEYDYSKSFNSYSELTSKLIEEFSK